MASKKELLTAKEVAEMFGYSVSTIEKNFQQPPQQLRRNIM